MLKFAGKTLEKKNKKSTSAKVFTSTFENWFNYIKKSK